MSESLALLRVKPGSRLIEAEHAQVRSERAGDAHELPLPSDSSFGIACAAHSSPTNDGVSVDALTIFRVRS
jgi:hypothetical protein